jgi:hypothetical protein
VASKAQSAGLKPGLYKGEEGFLGARVAPREEVLAALEMTESNRGKSGRVNGLVASGAQ